ncbi:cytochrome c oxidase subunit 3 [Tengunoibacter tsumagoiensis]|uniref:Heme-copper oxidase subunit III family profile domain-containing protein n=1 Tax=Tengunoibacter tsumagoiensis TaxID=2014871 RepID=A0A402A5N0_9CHLR|nr:heme-copper oxidase subunit III [Tengunoibacter tsumagoiensis]GCE14389.1 hypothetical protein KTT_42480 [Tengunoibacter tsumagoiensis]
MSSAHGEQVRVFEEQGHEEGGRSLNWWGMIFFIASEALIFANLIAVFLYLYIRDGANWQLPEAEILGSHLPAAAFPAGLNTIILLSSSIFMHMAGSAIRKGNQRKMIIGLIGTIVLGLIFLGGQVYEYVDFYGQNFTMTLGTKGSAFYTITGFHGIHVSIGALFLIICLIRGIRGDFTAKNHFAVEAAEMYWHFVDGVWIFVFSVVYLLPLLRG